MKPEILFGKSAEGNYACTREGDAVWSQVEAVGEFYELASYDDIPEDDWGRLHRLENRFRSVEAKGRKRA
jgi:hypothetical protein